KVNPDILTVTEGVYTDTVVIIGQIGDAPAGEIIEVYWDDTSLNWNGVKGKLNSTTANSDGSYKIQFQVPESVYGNHYIWVTTPTDSISAPILVQAIIYSTSSGGLAGDKIDVYVYGQSKEKNIAIVLVSNNGIANWNWVAATQVIVDFDAGETVYNGILTGDLVEPGSLVITVGLDVVTDDGVGSLEGDGKGSINYVTGEWYVEFDKAPVAEFTIDYNEFVEIADSDYLLSGVGTTNSVGSYTRRITLPDDIADGVYYIETLDGKGVSGSYGSKPAKLSVSLVFPNSNSTFDSSPVQLKVRVTSDGSSVFFADVDFYIDGSYLDTNHTDSHGFAYLNHYPTIEGTHTWNVKASKSGYLDKLSSIRSFTFSQQEPEPEPEPEPEDDDGISSYLVWSIGIALLFISLIVYMKQRR
ncbi:Ig-like domain-containing protein, partial [Thermoproteota archaeon]